MAQNRFNLPSLGYGLGLRQPHYDAVVQEESPVEWFEDIVGKLHGSASGHLEFLRDVRAKHPLVMHGVGMNIGGTDPINEDYIAKLNRLAEIVRPAWISDHLCFTGTHGVNSHDLLPVPYTKEALAHIARRIRQVQEMLGRPLVLENPSTYIEFTASSMPEWEFLAELAEKADCGLLLDVNNVYVSAFNHRYDARRYIDAIPANRVVYIHLAGHRNLGTHIIDTHDDHIIDAVWTFTGTPFPALGPRRPWSNGTAMSPSSMSCLQSLIRRAVSPNRQHERPHHECLSRVTRRSDGCDRCARFVAGTEFHPC